MLGMHCPPVSISKQRIMTQKKVLVLGSGMVAKPCVNYLLRDPRNSLTIGIFRHPSQKLIDCQFRGSNTFIKPAEI